MARASDKDDTTEDEVIVFRGDGVRRFFEERFGTGDGDGDGDDSDDDDSDDDDSILEAAAAIVAKRKGKDGNTPKKPADNKSRGYFSRS